MKKILKEKYRAILDKRIDMPYWLMMLIATSLGFLSFGLLFGFDIVNVTNDSWLCKSGHDISAHYLGWINYRKSPWRFPIGLQDSITYPYSFSVIYMDSMPIFALFFKVLSPILPKVFQYFGIAGLITFVLQGVVGCNIIYSKTKDTFYGVISSPFFILSPVVLQRMCGHSALAFHPIVLLAIYVYINRNTMKEKNRDLLYWCLLLALSVSVHAYYFPMVYLFIVAFYLPEIISRKKCYIGLIKIMIPVFVTLFVMYIWGYFYGDHNYNGGGFGVYNSNLNVLLNSQGNSFFGELMGITEYEGSFETYAYLGFGIIVMCIISLYDIFVTPSDYQTKGVSWQTVVVVTVFCVASVIPSIKLGPYILLDIDFPVRLVELLGTFRANGRFIWPVMYLILVAVLVHVFNRYKCKYVIVVLSLALQIIDLSPVYAGIIGRMDDLKTAHSILNDCRWDKISYKSEVFFMNNPVIGGPNPTAMAMGKYAADNNMIMNDFYASRKDETAIAKDRKAEEGIIFEGNPSDDRIYVFYDLPLEYLLYEVGLSVYEIDGITIGVTDDLGEDKLGIDSGIDLLKYTSVWTENTAEKLNQVDGSAVELEKNEFFSEYIRMPEGKYKFAYEGDNLDNAEFVITDGMDEKRIKPDNLVETDDRISFDIEMNKKTDLQIKCFNSGGKGEILLTDATVHGKKSKEKPFEIELGEAVSFVASSYNAAPYTVDGMSAPEKDATWTNGDEALFRFALDTDADTSIIQGIIDIASVFHAPQEVNVFINEEEVFSGVATDAGEIGFRFKYPPDGIINMRVLLPNATSPLDVGVSGDTRELALMIKTIHFNK